MLGRLGFCNALLLLFAVGFALLALSGPIEWTPEAVAFLALLAAKPVWSLVSQDLERYSDEFLTAYRQRNGAPPSMS